MTKKDLIDFLEPFDDKIQIVVHRASKNLIEPITYELKYTPYTDERPAIVAIIINGTNMDTPKFSILRYCKTNDYWVCSSVHNDYIDAVTEKRRLEVKGCSDLYVVGLTFITGPKELGLDDY